MDTIITEKPRRFSIWKNFVRFIEMIKLPWLLIGIAFALNLGRAIIGLVLPEKMAQITEIDLTGGDSFVKLAVSLCMTIFVLALVNFIIALAATYITLLAKAAINRDFQIVASKKLFSLRVKDIEVRDPKEFISRITTDTGFVSDFLIELLVNEIPRLYFIINTIINVARMKNGTLVMSFIIIIPVIILGSYWSGHVNYKTQNKLQQAMATLTARLAEKIGNMEIIKSYNNTAREIDSGNILIDEMKKAQKKNTMAEALNTLVSNILFVVPTLIIMIAGATQLLSNRITTPQFIQYFALGTTYQEYIAAHLLLWVLSKRAQGATQRLSDVMILPEDGYGSVQAMDSGTIEFRNVCFSYGDQETLNNVSFTIPYGSKFAIVGPSGSGKSTILNLIEQFYRPESGSILMNGKDISEYEIRSYRNRFAYLPQNAPGFSGTIRDMLCYGSDGSHTDEELNILLKDVNMYDSVRLSDEVGQEAAKLSGGQRQRLAVARMLLKDADIILADEATSALDVQGAKDVSELIDRHARGKTRVIVAHDLSLVTDADSIVVIDKGRVVDQGTHEELLKRCTLYRDMYNTGKEEQQA